MGGVNLLERSEEQQRLLEESARELERRQQKERQLQQALQMKEVRQQPQWAECRDCFVT